MHTGKAAAYLGFLAFVVSVGAAQADVIEIEPDGTTITYSAPSGSLPSAPEITRLRTGKARRLTAPKAIPQALHAAASRHALSDALVASVAWQESHWRQTSVSAEGARGLMQLMPSTANVLGVNAGDADQNAEGGAAYLAQLLQRFDGDIARTLAAYNAGPAAVVRYGGIPPYPETQKYVAAVLDRLADISLNQSSGASR